MGKPSISLWWTAFFPLRKKRVPSSVPTFTFMLLLMLDIHGYTRVRNGRSRHDRGSGAGSIWVWHSESYLMTSLQPPTIFFPVWVVIPSSIAFSMDNNFCYYCLQYGQYFLLLLPPVWTINSVTIASSMDNNFCYYCLQYGQ